MKPILTLLILFSAIALPALGELTAEDLGKIREIVKSSETRIKAEIKAEIKQDITDSEMRMKTYVDIKLEKVEGILNGRITAVEGRIVGIEKQITTLTHVLYWVMGVLIAAIAIPQAVIAWQNRTLNSIKAEIETLKQQRIVQP